ncbi:dnaJ homolog subfamily C member 24 isoform X2 [Dasypus novemcinctus]|uniref:dnaJ homolog subfamily C member 24 isoform X2 n=1 Tax=Dasypus novemcinctus TaxID=9361 RepID=UPI0039C94111
MLPPDVLIFGGCQHSLDCDCITLISKYHPDKQSTDVPAGAVEECIQKFIEIDQAWKILGNEETKKEYDLQRHEDNLRNRGAIDAQVCLEDLSWNEGGTKNQTQDLPCGKQAPNRLSHISSCSFILLVMDIQFFQHHLLKILFCPANMDLMMTLFR